MLPQRHILRADYELLWVLLACCIKGGANKCTNETLLNFNVSSKKDGLPPISPLMQSVGLCTLPPQHWMQSNFRALTRAPRVSSPPALSSSRMHLVVFTRVLPSHVTGKASRRSIFPASAA